jgi:hypothetical protein
MPSANYLYEEPMDESELSFLVKKREKEQRTFSRTLRTLTIAFVLLPFGAGVVLESIKRAKDPKAAIPDPKEPFAPYYFFIGILFLLLLLAMAGYVSYVRTLKKMLTDIKRGLKTVEQTTITQKMYMGHNNTYHFYVRSAFRLSIEVSAEDYERYEEGDEINIEYSTFSKVYFGYY